jgi:predicted negative regulator of RcsB-dependent stress response
MSSESTESTLFIEVLTWAEQNRKTLAVGFAGLVLLGAAVALYRYNKEQTEITANSALAQLPSGFDNAEKRPPVTSTDYLKVLEQYPGTDAGARATLLAAGTLFSEGKYTDAEQKFQQFLKDHPRHMFAASAAYGAAASLEAQGKLVEAETAYREVTTRYEKSSLSDTAKLGLARIYETKNQPEAALKIYDELSAPGKAAGFNPQAMTRKQDLLSKHPQLMRTNLPAASSLTNAVPLLKSATNSTAPASNAAPAPAAPATQGNQ